MAAPGQRTNFAPAMLAALLLHAALLIGGLVVWPWMTQPIAPGAVTAVTLVAAPPAPLRPAEQSTEPAPPTAPEPTPSPRRRRPPRRPSRRPPRRPTGSRTQACAGTDSSPRPRRQAKPAKDDSLDLNALASSLPSRRPRPTPGEAPAPRAPWRPEQARSPAWIRARPRRRPPTRPPRWAARLNRIWNKRATLRIPQPRRIQVQFHLTPDGDLEARPK